MAMQNVDSLAVVVLEQIERHVPRIKPEVTLLVLGKAAGLVRKRALEAATAAEEAERVAAIADRHARAAAAATPPDEKKVRSIKRNRRPRGELLERVRRGRESRYPGLKEKIRELSADHTFLLAHRGRTVDAAYEHISKQYPEGFVGRHYFNTLWFDAKREGKKQQ